LVSRVSVRVRDSSCLGVLLPSRAVLGLASRAAAAFACMRLRSFSFEQFKKRMSSLGMHIIGALL